MKPLSLNKKVVLIIAFLFLFLIIGYLFVSTSANNNDTLITKEHYENAIQLINEKLPIRLDAETELRSIMLEGTNVIYTYALLNKQKYEIKIDELQTSFQKEVLKTYCAQSDIMIAFRKSGYHAQYKYIDTHGEEIFTTTITPKLCSSYTPS